MSWAFRLAVLLLALPGSASAQLDLTPARGAYYTLEPELTADRFFSSVEVQRVAPGFLAPPAPAAPVETGVQLRGLTGQIFELPEQGRLYFPAVDSRGGIRLFELDLFGRLVREVRPPLARVTPAAVTLLAAQRPDKLYVRWWGPGAVPETEIYNGVTLTWLGTVVDFSPDPRVWGFEHRSPFLWAMGRGEDVVLVDAARDAVVRSIEPARWMPDGSAAVADAWRDLVLLRIGTGARYQVVDIVSGEIGPPLQLPYRERAVARLLFAGRLMILLATEPGPLTRYSPFRLSIATGAGTIFDLRTGHELESFNLVVPPELPSYALGTDEDPTVPGRLWVHALGDRQRFAFEQLPSCRRPPNGKELETAVSVSWDDRRAYYYSVSVQDGSPQAAGAFALEAGRATTRIQSPPGWGSDRLKGDRWVRWTNGLGPPSENVGAGSSMSGFALVADEETLPNIVAYRVQGAIGLPRGCESDDDFLDNGVAGYTVGPERVDPDDTKELARRLERLVTRACELERLSENACDPLRSLARRVESERGGGGSLDAFRAELAEALEPGPVRAVIEDGADAVRNSLVD